MKTIVELIHEDFDVAVENLIAISEGIRQKNESIQLPEKDQDFETGVFLTSLGFTNTPKAKSVEVLRETENQLKNQKFRNEKICSSINSVVSRYQATFPFHKFILLSQVLKICEKYNLYLSPAPFFKGEIPDKNIQELKNFPYEKYLTYDIFVSATSTKPISYQSMNDNFRFSSQFRNVAYNEKGKDYISYITSYICAPKEDFDLKNKNIIGREIYEDEEIGKSFFSIPKPEKAPKDPIILFPVCVRELPNECGFIVVTKWGLEAEDSRLVVPKNN